jgi:signal transduction histidine kinase
MFFTGYLIGSGNGPLAYNIELDPLFAAPFVIIGGIFFVYGSTYYEMMEIKIAAKGAFIYAVLVSCVGLILGTLNFVNSFVPTEYYEFLSLFFSFSIGGVLVGASAFIFRRIRQTDILRYEFMNIMTHKFLTPLNRIKWSAEELRKMNRPEEEQFISIIAKDSERLIEMMKLLSFLGDANSFQLNLHPTAINPSESAKTVLDNYKEELSEKNLNLKIYISSTSFVSMSLKEFTFILETLIDNAIKYTPANGNIVVSVSSDKKNIEISVSDTGIGISKDDLPYVFQKFYRGEKARTTYTEGMGIGLSTVKNVVKRNKGKIKALSKGMHQGTTFVVTLPIYKNVYGKLPAKI